MLCTLLSMHPSNVTRYVMKVAMFSSASRMQSLEDLPSNNLVDDQKLDLRAQFRPLTVCKVQA